MSASTNNNALIQVIDITNPLVQLVQKKRGSNREFFVNFFEACNLNCVFCWQDHKSWLGVDNIPQKADQILAMVRPGERSIINVMGGELFMDKVPNWVFDDYVRFCQRIHEGLGGENYVINFVTNLIHEDIMRVIGFFETLGAAGIRYDACTSYDPCGRFNAADRELFFENLEFYGDLLTNVSVVMTRPNIRYLMEHPDDDLFTKIYGAVPVFFDYYSPEKNREKLQPTDVELVDFMLWLNQHYPDAEPIRSYASGAENTTSCRSSTILLPSGETGSCRILANRDEFKSNPGVVDNIHEAEVRYVEHFGCLSCEYFRQCGLGCFLHADHVSITTQTCEFKRFYRSVAG